MQSLSRRLDSQREIEDYALPAADSLGPLLRFRDADADCRDRLEGVSTIYYNMCCAVNRFIEGNSTAIATARKYYERLAGPEIIGNVLSAVIAGSSASSLSVMTANTWQNLLVSLRHICQLCPGVCQQCVSGGLLGAVQRILLKEDPLPKARESAILFLDAILPQMCPAPASKKKKEQNKELATIESEKEAIVLSQGNLIQSFSSGVLSRLIMLFEEASGSANRFACMQTIDKLFALCTLDTLAETISPQTAARIVNANMGFPDSLFVCLGLRFLEGVMEKLAPGQPMYVSQMRREGVFGRVKQLLDVTYLLGKYDEEKTRGWLEPENQYVKLLMGEAQTMHKKWAAQKRRASSGVHTEEDDLPPIRSALVRSDAEDKFLSTQKRWNPGFLSRNLNYFIYIKGSLLSEKFMEDETYLKQCPTLEAGDMCLSRCHKLASDFAAAAGKGDQAGLDDWRPCFRELADILVSEESMTNYEATQSAVIQRIYEALLAPHEARREAAEDRFGIFRQMAIRHTAFAEAFLSGPRNNSMFAQVAIR